MDQKITAYFESLVLEVLQIPEFVSLNDEQKEKLAEKLRDHFNNIIIDMILDKLTAQQLNRIKDIPADSPEMIERLEEFATTSPFLITDMEKRLTEEVSKIKENPLSWAI